MGLIYLNRKHDLKKNITVPVSLPQPLLINTICAIEAKIK